mgnify:CR=1 FL=1
MLSNSFEPRPRHIPTKKEVYGRVSVHIQELAAKSVEQHGFAFERVTAQYTPERNATDIIVYALGQGTQDAIWGVIRHTELGFVLRAYSTSVAFCVLM